MLSLRDYYGCDAGCLDPPVKLGVQAVQFPVKLTDPPTALLYITGNPNLWGSILGIGDILLQFYLLKLLTGSSMSKPI